MKALDDVYDFGYLLFPGIAPEDLSEEQALQVRGAWVDFMARALGPERADDHMVNLGPDPLTSEWLESHRGLMFATGVLLHPDLYREKVRWIAKVGDGFHDWAIYYHTADKSRAFIRQQGDKCTTESIIRGLVHCTDEAFELYRM